MSLEFNPNVGSKADTGAKLDPKADVGRGKALVQGVIDVTYEDIVADLAK